MDDFDGDANLKATELRLGLPGSTPDDDEPSKLASSSKGNKRAFLELASEPRSGDKTGTNIPAASGSQDREMAAPPAKAHIVGWPPVRSYRKNSLQPKKPEADASGAFIKVSMDGAPYLRKIDVKQYKSYPELLKTLEKLFNFSIGDYSEGEYNDGSEYAPTYEDKDGDWMLVGDVPWNMFISTCKRLRIMRGQEARGLTCL